MTAAKRRAIQELITIVSIGLVFVGVWKRDWTLVGLGCFFEIVKCGHALTEIAGYMDDTA